MPTLTEISMIWSLEGLGKPIGRLSRSQCQQQPYPLLVPQKCTMPELEAATQMLSLAKTLASPPCITLSNILGYHLCASQVVLVVKKLPANAGDIRDAVLIPGLGRSPGGGHGNPL